MTLWFMAIVSFCCGWVVFYFITSPILDEYLLEIGLSLIGYAFFIPILVIIYILKSSDDYIENILFQNGFMKFG